MAIKTLDVLFNDFDDDSGVEKSSEFLITVSMIHDRQLGTEAKLKCHRTKPIQIGPTWRCTMASSIAMRKSFTHSLFLMLFLNRVIRIEEFWGQRLGLIPTNATQASLPSCKLASADNVGRAWSLM